MAGNASSSNPQSSQVMPDRLKKAVKKSEKEIEEFTVEWKQLLARKEGHLKRMEDEEKEIKRMKREIKDKESRIRQENLHVHNIVQQFPVLQAQITEKQAFIDRCNALYP